MLEPWLQDKLKERKQKDLLRTLPHQKDRIDFTSNDYIGFSRREDLFDMTARAVALLPKRNGSTGSRLLSGNSVLAEQVEMQLAGIFKSPKTLLFNSGYLANVAVLSAIPQKDDTILYDELSHASIKDGARLSLARKFSFRHNDLDDLEKKILRSQGRIFIVVESIYSMDGDECPLEGVIALSERYGCSVILDEAHSTGARGPRGSGIAVEKGLHDKITARIYTFGKAMGVCGACVAGTDNLIEYLVNFARPFVYTTAPSPHTVMSIHCAFELLEMHPELQDTLKEKVALFLGHAKDLSNRTDSHSAIQTIIVPGNTAVRKKAEALQQKGFDVRPILSPTVPVGTERIRICLHTFNHDEDIINLTATLRGI